MIVATVTGNLGKDAKLRDTQGGSVLGFSVASTTKTRNGETTHWVDCSLWGKRGEALAQYLSKGTKVAVVGELGTREHEGKTYLTLRVDQIELMGGGGGRREGGRSESRNSSESNYEDNSGPAPNDEEIPF